MIPLSSVQEEELSDLISALGYWLENQHNGFFIYKSVNLRGAFERYIYFEAIAGRTSSLLSLMHLCHKWRESTSDNQMAILYDDLFKDINQEYTRVARFKSYIYAWGRWLQDVKYFLHDFTSFIVRKKISPNAFDYGFFLISPRFIEFFADIVNKIGREHCIYIPNRSDTINSATQLNPNFARFVCFGSHPVIYRPSQLPHMSELVPIFSRLITFYRHVHTLLKTYRPKVLLFSEGTSHYDEIASIASKTLGIRTVRLQSGRAGVIHSGYRRMSFDIMLCWSEDFVQRFRTYSPEPKYIVIGSPLLDEYVQLKHVKISNSILVITQPVSKHINENDYMMLVKLVSEIVNKLTYRVIIRKHPVDLRSDFDKLASAFPNQISLMSSSTYSLAYTFSKSLCAVGFFSTALSEAAACEVFPIIVQTKSSQSVYPYPEKHQAAILTNSISECIEKIIEIFESPEKYIEMRKSMKSFSIKFFGYDDGLSKDRIIREIKSAIDFSHAK